MKLKRVRWELGCQMIVPPEEAMERQELLQPHVTYLPLNDFPVGDSGEQLARGGEGS